MVDRVVADLGLSAVEADLLRTSILSSDFVEQFIIGPSFGKAHLEYMAKQLYDAPATLGHAYTASAMSWGDDSHVASPERGPSSGRSDYFEKMYQHATAAVATLRSMQPSNAREMCLCLVLGATIMTFTLKVQVANARAICRQTLELAKPIHTRDDLLASALPEDLAFASCLVLTDVAESLLFCEPPTVRYRTVPSQPQYVDRFVGISHSFLPLLHDVAELSYNLKIESVKAGGHAAAVARFAQTHHALEQDTRKWTPDGHGGLGGSAKRPVSLLADDCMNREPSTEIRFIGCARPNRELTTDDEQAPTSLVDLHTIASRAGGLAATLRLAEHKRKSKDSHINHASLESHALLLVTDKETTNLHLFYAMHRHILSASLLLLAKAIAEPGSNYNVSREFALANGCGEVCQQNMAAANRQDLDIFGHDFDVDFYKTASNFSTSKAGAMLKLQPVDPKPLNIRSGTSIYRLQYSPQDLDGSLVPATAFIAFPFAPPPSPRDSTNSAVYPLAAYAHGTSAIYRGCAPSGGPSLYDYDSWQLLVERGHAVVATDYAGLGNNHMLHKYGSYVAQANDVLFSVVAARQAFDGKLFSADWMSVGHSQGGTTVWKLSESRDADNDEHYLDTVALAPAARLWTMFRLNLATPGAFLGLRAVPRQGAAARRPPPSTTLTVLAEPLRARARRPGRRGAALLRRPDEHERRPLRRADMSPAAGIEQDHAAFQAWEDEMSPPPHPGSKAAAGRHGGSGKPRSRGPGP